MARRYVTRHLLLAMFTVAFAASYLMLSAADLDTAEALAPLYGVGTFLLAALNLYCYLQWRKLRRECRGR